MEVVNIIVTHTHGIINQHQINIGLIILRYI